MRKFAIIGTTCGVLMFGLAFLETQNDYSGFLWQGPLLVLLGIALLIMRRRIGKDIDW